MTFHFMRFVSLRLWATLCFCSCIGACAPLDSTRLPQSGDAALGLRVMSFNIEWGGALISFDNVVKAIQLADADVVGIQEAEGNLQRLANELGWHYDLQNYVISKHPLIDPPGADGRYVYVEVEPGKIIAIANVHLPSDPYGPDAVRDGATLEDVLQLEQIVRMPAIEPYLSAVSQLAEQGIPLFMTGDFNTPAHTDWTDAMVGSRKFMRYPVAWPVSQVLTDAGLTDSWRAVHPDPLQNPGLTWWAGRPPLAAYAPGESDAQDRIDFIWFAGSADARSSEILGEVNGPEVAIALTPWPSDHRALVSEFLVVPADLPEFVSTTHRVYQAGTDVDITFNTAGGVSINIVNADTLAPIFRQIVLPGRDQWSVPESLFQPGRYHVQLSNPATTAVLTREFWVLPSGAAPSVDVAGSSFAVGEGIDVRWSNAPGNRNDYLAAYEIDVETGYDNGLAWTYIAALPNGQKRLDESTSAWGWPLQPGNYVIRLVKDDGYDSMAESAPFVVESRVVLPDGVLTANDGRRPIKSLFAAYQKLLDQGWKLDVIANSQPIGTSIALPIIALRSPVAGPAAWFLAGVHGEEPAGPNAIAAAIDDLAELGEKYPVVLLPLLNPQGYVRNWRYLNVPVYSESIDGHSVGDSSHMLPDSLNPGEPRAAASSSEADAITGYIMKTIGDYPPRYSIDLHEDNLISEGYVYSQGELGAADPLAGEAVSILRQNDIGIKMDGQTRFDEDIVSGIIGPVTDSSIDELMSSKIVIVNDGVVAGPGAATVLVFETPAADLTLSQRVNAHTALIRRLAFLIGNAESR